ncbi:hypothetical protein AMS68_002601 [Peltaster fructicola]|uniref:BZIP domain-containing protein n=1 Tax=Peltaster fructicola TaxID=286661 RepID=A0A6H0XQS7_9PEZI|nr:hypothetical protein AMS68_002601 [Peltaster fructicola]
MALPTQRYSFQQTPGDDNKVYGFDSDSSASILDPSLLDSDMMHHPVAARFRKDSFAASHGILTPTDSHAWTTQYQDSPAQVPYKAENQYADALQQIDTHHAIPNHAWMAPRSGNGTPTAALDMMPPPSHFDTMHYMQPKPTDRAMEHRSYSGMQSEPQYMSAPHVQAHRPTHEYMALAQAEAEARPTSKRLRSDSPTRPVIDIRRDGGIQKKNKRIDIPHERNIQTIDQMIETTKDEDLLKELKAQKRLLRNREAA